MYKHALFTMLYLLSPCKPWLKKFPNDENTFYTGNLPREDWFLIPFCRTGSPNATSAANTILLVPLTALTPDRIITDTITGKVLFTPRLNSWNQNHFQAYETRLNPSPERVVSSRDVFPFFKKRTTTLWSMRLYFLMTYSNKIIVSS